MTERPADSHSQSGFTLVEVAIVLVVVGLLIGMFSHIGVGYLKNKQRESTLARLDAVEEALVRFVAASKRLPCPDTDGDGLAQPAGAGGCTASQADGVVPWVTLGLTQAAVTDGWNRKFVYRVLPDLGDGSAAGWMNMGWSGFLGWLPDKGLLVQEVDGATTRDMMDPDADPPTGAAYVLVSHGEGGGGVNEDAHADGEDVRLDPDGYFNYGPVDVAGASHFDDLVRARTILDLAMRAGQGPGT